MTENEIAKGQTVLSGGSEGGKVIDDPTWKVGEVKVIEGCNYRKDNWQAIFTGYAE